MATSVAMYRSIAIPAIPLGKHTTLWRGSGVVFDRCAGGDDILYLNRGRRGLQDSGWFSAGAVAEQPSPTLSQSLRSFLILRAPILLTAVQFLLVTLLTSSLGGLVRHTITLARSAPTTALWLGS